MLYGIDLHRNSMTVAAKSPTSAVTDPCHSVVTYSHKNYGEFFSKLQAKDQLAIECVNNAWWFVRTAQNFTSHVNVVNTHQFRIVSHSSCKSDKRDAVNICMFLQAGMLPTVWIPPQWVSEAREMVGQLEFHRKQITRIRNRILALFSHRGEALQGKHVFSVSGRQRLNKILSTYTDSFFTREVRSLLDEYDRLTARRTQVREELIYHVDRHAAQELAYASTITGIGLQSAAILLAVIGDIRRFPTDRTLVSYFGLNTTVKQSNQTTHLGKISKEGSSAARATLSQCAFPAVLYTPSLRIYYHRLSKRRGKGRAIVAVMNKLTKRLWHILTTHTCAHEMNDVTWSKKMKELTLIRKKYSKETKKVVDI